MKLYNDSIVNKGEYDYGIFEAHKVSSRAENLDMLEGALSEDEIKRKRILAVKRARIKMENTDSQTKVFQTPAGQTSAGQSPASQKDSDDELNIEDPSESVIFDWEVPFMDDDTVTDYKEKKTKKSDKGEKSRKSDKGEKNRKSVKSEKSQKSAKKDEHVILTKTKFPIGAKLIGIISSLLIISLMGVTYLVSYFISADTRLSAEENNMTINSRTAMDVQNRLDTLISNVEIFLDLQQGNKNDIVEVLKNSNNFFSRYKEIVAIYLPETEDIYTNRNLLISNEVSESSIKNYILGQDKLIASAKNGLMEIDNSSPVLNFPCFSIFCPIKSDEITNFVVVYSCEKLANDFSSGSVNQSFMVNSEGIVLVHPDLSAMLSAADYSKNPIVAQLLNDNQKSEQFYYRQLEGETEVEYIGAYERLEKGNCGVITTVKTDIVLEGIKRTTRRNIYLTIATLSIAIMIIWFFSASLSTPLKTLTEVTNQINQGNFDEDVFESLDFKRRDEIGVLISSTKNEHQILNTFSHLTNKAVTKAVIRKEIDFDAHLKDITIFFSDIRGFTAISDGFSKRFGEKSAGEIIGFLNDYMSRMVECITITGGNVDKFEGDAIMACWGVLRNDSLDYEQLADSDPQKQLLQKEHEEHVKQDAIAAIKTVVAMRYALMKYNKDAEIFTKEHMNDEYAQYKPHIRIGCGINTGRATVGFMGSFDKMEFTSIGDSVNLASRTEASNKPCGTDGLMTEATYNLLKKDFIRCEENNYKLSAENEENEIIVEEIPVTFEVKGKGKQHFYGIVNMPQLDIEKFFRTTNKDFVADSDCVNCVGRNGPKNLNEVRNLLGIPIPDFEGVNLDEEENKTKITAQ